MLRTVASMTRHLKSDVLLCAKADNLEASVDLLEAKYPKINSKLGMQNVILRMLVFAILSIVDIAEEVPFERLRCHWKIMLACILIPGRWADLCILNQKRFQVDHCNLSTCPHMQGNIT